MSDDGKTKYHNSTFENIAEEKRRKILKIAAQELASAGLSGARVKDIARMAEVSYGSMYNYFPSRDDMIRTIIQEGRAQQEEIFADFRHIKTGFFDKLQQVLVRIQALADQHPAMIAIWVEVSHSYNERFADDVMALEADGIKFWKKMLASAVDSGEISVQTDINSAAFLIDSAVSGLIKAGISSVQRKRINLFFQCTEETMAEGEPESRQAYYIDVSISLVNSFRKMLS